MEYHFKVHKNKKGFWAQCLELKGCVTQGDNIKELSDNMEEVLNLYLDEPEDSQIVFPLPKKKVRGKNIVKVTVNPKIALSSCIRRARVGNQLTQKKVATMLGFKHIYNYQRLESSKKANPEFLTLIRLKKIFPQLCFDEILASS